MNLQWHFVWQAGGGSRRGCQERSERRVQCVHNICIEINPDSLAAVGRAPHFALATPPPPPPPSPIACNKRLSVSTRTPARTHHIKHSQLQSIWASVLRWRNVDKVRRFCRRRRRYDRMWFGNVIAPKPRPVACTPASTECDGTNVPA